MAFSDFTFPNAIAELGLTLDEQDLFGSVEPLTLAPSYLERLRSCVELGSSMNTEKARSEFLIAPLFAELRFLRGRTFGIFSGVPLDVDASRGLNGFCDFVLTRSHLQTVLTAPILAVVEAKNDNLFTGMGQCIAATVAAREYNLMEKRPPAPVYGAVTTGALWRMLRLEGSALTLDTHEFHVTEPGRIIAILASIVS